MIADLSSLLDSLKSFVMQDRANWGATNQQQPAARPGFGQGYQHNAARPQRVEQPAQWAPQGDQWASRAPAWKGQGQVCTSRSTASKCRRSGSNKFSIPVFSTRTVHTLEPTLHHRGFRSMLLTEVAIRGRQRDAFAYFCIDSHRTFFMQLGDVICISRFLKVVETA